MAELTRKSIKKKKIVVTGDLTIDWIEASIPFVTHDDGGSNTLLSWQAHPGVKRFARIGGAGLMANFVRAATGADVLHPELKNIEQIPSDEVIHAYMTVSQHAFLSSGKNTSSKNYRIKTFAGYTGPEKDLPNFFPIERDDPSAEIVVLDDAGNGFREAKIAWPTALKKRNRPIVIIKMGSPLTQGSLWEELKTNLSEKLVVVITADDLRSQGIKISRRLSWEQTAKDFVWQMASNPKLFALSQCAWVIVRFGVEGAILYSRREGFVESILFFDPKTGEDGFGDNCPGQMIGLGCAFTAGLTERIARQGLSGVHEGVRQGILSSQRLWLQGFGSDLKKLDYPGKEIFRPNTNHDPLIADVAIPNPSATEPADPDYWCILDELTQTGLENIAYNYVICGNDPVMDSVPVGQFRYLKTYDRSEIERFRSIKNLIWEYLNASLVSRPLSIAVFGAPGSGKSFGVTEVAESVAPGKLKKLEFNISQFNSIEELNAAFHKVRDVALEGKVPMVFFDEFDSEFDGKLGWLKKFLAPMQDGEFSDGRTTHPIGRSIFVFAGGTCATFAEFCRRESCPESEGEDRVEFKNAKGPDFVSRLRGYVNIKGPNPVNKEEKLFLIRRALFIRFLLEQNAKQIFERNKRCRIDPGVLRAMIKVPMYRHGVRSILALIEMSMLSGRNSFEQAALPSPEQLELHVDEKIFSRLVVRDVLLGSARDVIAQAIHEKYRNGNKGKKPDDDPAMASWDELAEDYKESNRMQADDIPIKLKAVGCDFIPVLDRKPKLMRFSKKEIETMAEIEHDRFVAERFLQGWSSGPRDIGKKTSPYLVGWNEIPEEIKEYDRQAVQAIPKLLSKAGFEIYRLKDN